MKKKIIPLIISISLLLVIVPIIIFSVTRNNKNNNNVTTKPSDDDIIIPTPIEIPDGVSNEVAAKVYSSIAVELMNSGYDVFNAIKVTSDGSEYGLGYTDYNESYSSEEYSKIFLSTGFISFANEENKVKSDDLTFINYIDEYGNEIFDEKYSFIYTYNDSSIKKGHFILNNKYIKYEVNDGYLNIEELESKKENYDLSIGSIYNYDYDEFEFIPFDEIDSSPDEIEPLIVHLDSEEIKNELENIIKKQNEDGNKVEGIYISYISNDVLQAYANKETHMDSLNGFRFEDLDSIEYDNEKEILCFGSDGDVYIRSLPVIPPKENNKGLWDYVVDGLVMVGAGAVAVVGVVASPYTGGASLMLSAAAIGAGAQYFSETIINGKKFSEVNWTKVAIMGVSGAIGAAVPCAGVAGYFAAGVVGGLTSGIMTAIDGGSSKEILLSSVKGATISILTHGLFASCFVEGTKVLTNNGLINIENIRKGMYVLSYNELLGITEYKKVIETYDNKSTYFTDLTLANGETITSTYNHPYYVPELKQYIKAGALDKGMEVIDCDGNYIRIHKVYNYYGNRTVYNLNVENNHNYYVGNNNLLVHNTCPRVMSNRIAVNSESVKNMTKTVVSNLTSKPAITTLGVLITGKIILDNSNYNFVKSVDAISNETGRAFDTWTSFASDSTDNLLENEIKKKVKDILSDLHNKGEEDYGWTESELESALSDSFCIAKEGELVKADTKEKIRHELVIYLGRYPDYKNTADNDAKFDNKVGIFSMDNDDWNKYLDIISARYPEKDRLIDKEFYDNAMWIANRTYLDCVISLGCVFVLVTPPNDYCSLDGKIVTGKENIPYARELKHIYQRAYRWKYPNLPNKKATIGGIGID